MRNRLSKVSFVIGFLAAVSVFANAHGANAQAIGPGFGCGLKAWSDYNARNADNDRHNPDGSLAHSMGDVASYVQRERDLTSCRAKVQQQHPDNMGVGANRF